MSNEKNVCTAVADMENRREYRRLLCSDLITVHWGSGRGSVFREAAVLEDYSATGASLYIVSKIEPGVAITIRTALESFGALVLRCVWREDGYLLGVEFDEPRVEGVAFMPDHLLDPEELGI
jgi:hypothetical protein